MKIKNKKVESDTQFGKQRAQYGNQFIYITVVVRTYGHTQYKKKNKLQNKSVIEKKFEMINKETDLEN